MGKLNINFKETKESPISLSDIEKVRYNRFQNESCGSSRSKNQFTFIKGRSNQIERENLTVSIQNTAKAVPGKSVFDRISRPITVKNTVQTAANIAKPMMQQTAIKNVTQDIQIKKNNNTISIQNKVNPISVQRATKTVFERITEPQTTKNTAKTVTAQKIANSVATQNAEKSVSSQNTEKSVPTQNATKTVTAKVTANTNVTNQNTKNVNNEDKENKEKPIIDVKLKYEQKGLCSETKDAKDYSEISGEDIEVEDSTYSRVVIIGEDFLSNFSKCWPSESKIKPYILYKNKLRCDELFAKFSDHQFLKNSNKILVVFVLGLHDFAEYGTHVNSSCKGNHKITEYLHKLTAVKGYATTLADIKKKFLINENLSVVFSYFPPFHNINLLSDIYNWSEVENLDCGCSVKDKKTVFDQYVKSDFTAVTQIYQRLILINQLNFVRECGIMEYMPPQISFANGNWKITMEGEKTVKDVAVLDHVINEFIFNTVCNNDSKSLDFKEQFSTMRNLILKPKYRIALIGDRWLYSILRQWPGNFTGCPTFYIAENFTFNDLRKAILSLFKSDEIGVVVATVPSGELFSTKSSKCVNHRPVEYPVPNENILKDPVNFAHQLIEKMNILIQDMKELRQNCRIIFTTSYPINFSSYYNHLSTTHFKTVGKKQHIDSSSIIDIEYDDFDTKISQCTDMIDKYIQTANDEQMIPTCKISQAVISSGQNFVFPTYVEDICPSLSLGKELFKYVKLYVGLFNSIQFDSNNKLKISYPQKEKYLSQLHKLGHNELKSESNKRPLTIDTAGVNKKVKPESLTLKTDKKTPGQDCRQKMFVTSLSAHSNVTKQGLLGDHPPNESNRQGLLGDHPPSGSQSNSNRLGLLGKCSPIDSQTNKKGLLGDHPTRESEVFKCDLINDQNSFQHKTSKQGLLGDGPMIDFETNRQTGLKSKSLEKKKGESVGVLSDSQISRQGLLGDHPPNESNKQGLLGDHPPSWSQTNRQGLLEDHPSKDSLPKRQGLLGDRPRIDSQTNKKGLLGDHPSGEAKGFMCDLITDHNSFNHQASKQCLLGNRIASSSCSGNAKSNYRTMSNNTDTDQTRHASQKIVRPSSDIVKSLASVGDRLLLNSNFKNFDFTSNSSQSKDSCSAPQNIPDHPLALDIIESLAAEGDQQMVNIQSKHSKNIGKCSDSACSVINNSIRGNGKHVSQKIQHPARNAKSIADLALIGDRQMISNKVEGPFSDTFQKESDSQMSRNKNSSVKNNQDSIKILTNIPDNPLALDIIKSLSTECDQQMGNTQPKHLKTKAGNLFNRKYSDRACSVGKSNMQGNGKHIPQKVQRPARDVLKSLALIGDRQIVSNQSKIPCSNASHEDSNSINKDRPGTAIVNQNKELGSQTTKIGLLGDSPAAYALTTRRIDRSGDRGVFRTFESDANYSIAIRSELNQKSLTAKGQLKRSNADSYSQRNKRPTTSKYSPIVDDRQTNKYKYIRNTENIQNSNNKMQNENYEMNSSKDVLKSLASIGDRQMTSTIVKGSDMISNSFGRSRESSNYDSFSSTGNSAVNELTSKVYKLLTTSFKAFDQVPSNIDENRQSSNIKNSQVLNDNSAVQVHASKVYSSHNDSTENKFNKFSEILHTQSPSNICQTMNFPMCQMLNVQDENSNLGNANYQRNQGKFIENMQHSKSESKEFESESSSRNVLRSLALIGDRQTASNLKGQIKTTGILKHSSKYDENEKRDFCNKTNLGFSSTSGTHVLSQEARPDVNVFKSLDSMGDRQMANVDNLVSDVAQGNRDFNTDSRTQHAQRGGRPSANAIRSLALVGDRRMANVDDSVLDDAQGSRNSDSRRGSSGEIQNFHFEHHPSLDHQQHNFQSSDRSSSSSNDWRSKNYRNESMKGIQSGIRKTGSFGHPIKNNYGQRPNIPPHYSHAISSDNQRRTGASGEYELNSNAEDKFNRLPVSKLDTKEFCLTPNLQTNTFRTSSFGNRWNMGPSANNSQAQSERNLSTNNSHSFGNQKTNERINQYNRNPDDFQRNRNSLCETRAAPSGYRQPSSILKPFESESDLNNKKPKDLTAMTWVLR